MTTRGFGSGNNELYWLLVNSGPGNTNPHVSQMPFDSICKCKSRVFRVVYIKLMYHNLAVTSFIILHLLVYLPLKFLIRAVIMNFKDEETCSDDEVFFGKLSLSELKRMFISNQNNRQTISNEHLKDENLDTSLQLISTHSEPNLTTKLTSTEIIPKALSSTTLSPDEPNLYANWDVTSSDNSFLKLEKIIEQSCDSTVKDELDNTLDEIERILNNGPATAKENTSKKALEINALPNKGDKSKLALNIKPTAVITPVKQNGKEKEVFSTPSSTLSKPSTFRTPRNAPIFKKPSTSSVKRTPSKNNAFQHVASPVAYYINNSPQIPLIQNVHPKKNLPGLSSIPKLVKSTAIKPSNKENVSLPTVAYKSAKKTTMIDVSNGPKLPQTQWAKKLTKSLPRPAVIKHNFREKNLFNKLSMKKPEDSFGDLTLHQADVSVCTKRTAI